MVENTRLTIQAQEDRIEGWKRIRVGVTGLAAILVLIGLASAMFSRLSQQAGVAAGSVPAGNATAVAPDKNSKDEPLAELGVAPGAPEAETTPAAQPPGAARPQPRP